jgi:broad specificity phosphatase PhoE
VTQDPSVAAALGVLAPEHRAGEATVILARHGRTEWNVAGRFQGHGDPPLDAVGRAQAKAAADGIAAFVSELHASAVELVSSDLVRAEQTAACVATTLGVPVRTDAALREVYLGDWEGLRPAEAATRFPEEWRAWSAGLDVRRGQGETQEEAGRRVAAVIDRELRTLTPANHLGGVLVVVGHGLALRAAMAHLAACGRIRSTGEGLAVGDGLARGDGQFGGAPHVAAPHLENGCWIALAAAAED